MDAPTYKEALKAIADGEGHAQAIAQQTLDLNNGQSHTNARPRSPWRWKELHDYISDRLLDVETEWYNETRELRAVVWRRRLKMCRAAMGAPASD